MKFSIKKKPAQYYENEFLLFPRRFNNEIYWMCWVTVQYTFFISGYGRCGDVFAIGKKAKELNESVTEFVMPQSLF